MDMKQDSLMSFKSEEVESNLVVGEFDQYECRMSLARMIIVDGLPFSFIEREGFQHFCSIAIPTFQLVSRVTIAKDCMRIFADLKKDLKKNLSLHAHRVCLTTSTWTSLQNLNYIVLTAHFIDDNWKLHKRMLNFSPISSHEGVAIGNAIESCMRDWGINKIFTMTIDNASSNDTAIAHMKKTFSKKNVFALDGEFYHMPCCAYILNLFVRDGMEEEADSIERIRLAVWYVRSSSQRIEQFKTCCELDENRHSNNLVLDVPTRWDYTYLMLDTAIKFQKSFERFEGMDPNYVQELKDKVPRDDDWRNARTFCKFLKIFYDVTNRLSGSLYVTANSYFRDVIKILSTIKTWSNSHDPVLKAMSLRMNEHFDKYWGDPDKIDVMLLIAVVLDPCYKFKFVIYCFERLYSKEVVKKVEHKLKDTLDRLYAYYDSIDSSAHLNKLGESSTGFEKCLGDNDVDDEFDFSYEKEYWEMDKRTELEKYLDERIIRKLPGETFDILDWWKVSSSRFPVLSLMARDVLAIPVSTAASEYAFSTDGHILDRFRSSLSPMVAEAMICAQDWLRASPFHDEIKANMEDFATMDSIISGDPTLASAFISQPT